ncbi:MAG: alpha/beta hydrolase, partial [Longimicrobiales bacterium]|nr:alpha/beta hydrolase [Longimicrobiales bacterium]
MKTKRIPGFVLLLVALGFPGSLTAQAPATESEADVQVTPDVVYGHKDGMALTFDVFRPSNAHGGAVLYMVSGGWVSRWSPPEWLITRSFGGLLEKGLTVMAVRHGSAPRYKVPEAEADVRRALRYIRLHSEELGVDEDRLGVFGGSAGGHLSLMLGLASDDGVMDSNDEILRTPARVAAVVAYYPPVDLRAIVGPSERFPALDFSEEQAASISPILFASPDDPPTLLIHGDADMLVNVGNSEVM